MPGQNGHKPEERPMLDEVVRENWGGADSGPATILEGLDLSGLALTQDYRAEAKERGEEDEDEKERRAWSGIAADFQGKINIAGLWGFMTDFRPKTKKERDALRSVADVVDREMHSDVCQRKRITEEIQKEQKKWMGKIPAAEKEGELANARFLYSTLERAEQVLINLREQYNANPPGMDPAGLAREAAMAAQWETQQERVRQVKVKAAESLCHEAYMYFLESVKELRIMQEVAADIAGGLVVRDYSDLLEELGDDVTNLETQAPEMYGGVLKYCLMEQSTDNAKLLHLQHLFSHTVGFTANHKRGMFSRKPPEQSGNGGMAAPMTQEYR